MKPARKRVSVENLVVDAGTVVQDLFITQPKAWLERARGRMRDLPKTNFELGCDFAEQGKWVDAIFRFRITLYLQPEYPLAWYNLGCCYFRHGDRAKARSALLKALAQAPGHQDTIFMLAAIDPAALKPGDRPEHMPKAMVTGFFTSIAEGYDITEARNQYQAGTLVFDLVKPLVAANDLVVTDLGCGTGIAARPWRLLAREIAGVELTPAMGALAAEAVQSEKRLFDQLIEGDIGALPDRLPAGTSDVVLAVNVVQFVGALDGVIKGAARLLRPGGVFVITIEPFAAPTGFGLSTESGRFGHSPAYVTQLAAQYGLTLVKEAKADLYPQTPAQILVFTKGTTA